MLLNSPQQQFLLLLCVIPRVFKETPPTITSHVFSADVQRAAGEPQTGYSPSCAAISHPPSHADAT